MEKLIQAIHDTNNISKVEYDRLSQRWVIKYCNGIEPTICDSEDLIDVIENL